MLCILRSIAPSSIDLVFLRILYTVFFRVIYVMNTCKTYPDPCKTSKNYLRLHQCECMITGKKYTSANVADLFFL